MSKKTQLRLEKLLGLLADGKFHSGQSLAEQLEISRTAVWKLIQKIQQWQVTVYSIRGRGYQIPGGLELLDKQVIERALVENNELFKQVISLTSIDSTSSYLSEDWQANPGKGRVCVAEHQTAGRGRKGRQWISPFGANFYFSIGLELPLGLSALGGVSLVVGMSLCDTLNQYVGGKIRIKWPNDLLIGEKKLAGILVEASGETNDVSFLNIGVGVNWSMEAAQGDAIDQPWTNLKSHLTQAISRNEILSSVLVNLDCALQRFLANGFSPLTESWSSQSAFYNREVEIHLPNQTITGKEVGIEPNGALKIETSKGIEIFHSGEVSLRKRKLVNTEA